MILLIIRLFLAFIFAFLLGKLVSKIKLPAILGWLIAGMLLGPHAISLINIEIIDAKWYETLIHILECTVGLMIGTELVWSKIKKFGKPIIITTFTQSLGTFFIVSLVFAILFYFMNVPIYLSLIFGGIALATAPAPTLSIVREFKTKGPVTKLLVPMAALDDIIGCVVFFTIMAVVAGNLSAGSLPAYMIALIVVFPLLIGAVCGIVSGFILKKETSDRCTFLLLSITILLTSAIGFFFNNQVMPKPVLNFMLIGMAFSAAFSNMISEERLEQIMRVFNPVLGVAMIIVILNLGAPLDYHLIFGAGLSTAVYIFARSFGKYFGAYFGSSITKAPEAVKKYLGLTLLPHSGVSLVFTGIAVSVLSNSATKEAQIVQGTIAAAAVINEIIAVIMAKKGFEWAGELNQSELKETLLQNTQPIITISRQYGSGGRDIALQLSKDLNIPFYDKEIIEMAVESSSIKRTFFENYETDKSKSVLTDLSESISIGSTMDDQIYEHNARIIHQLASQGSCIIVGRCGDVVLKERKNVIKIFIYGDKETRRKRIVEVYKEAPNEAFDLLKKVDRNRSSYYAFYSGKPFGDAKNYDICLNSSVLGIEECIRIIESIYKTYL